MQTAGFLLHNPFPKKRKLFLRAFLFFLVHGLAIQVSFAHPSPNTLVFLDVSPQRVAMEIQLPVPELKLAFGHNLSENPETIVDRVGPQLKEYILAHVHAYIIKDRPWQVVLISLQMDKGKYVDTNIPYWEVTADLILQPPASESTRRFFLEYDVIMHQVVTHTALLSLRSDWENGAVQSNAEVGVIRWYLSDNKIHPIEINLETGSRWKGFVSMFTLGMQHIREGTDHLLFLLVLLLPSMLLLNGNFWGRFGGIQYSARHLLQIVTAFTIGHSITLFISAAGWLKLPSQPVEILIAFSIFISAIHALYPLFSGKEMYVAAGFGLIHGLAFATVLFSMKLSSSTLALSILGFNLGIEAMQLFIVLITVPWLILLSITPVYKWVRITGATLAGIAALAWIAERSVGKPNTITKAIVAVTRFGWWSIAALVVVSLAVFGWYQYKGRRIFST